MVLKESKIIDVISEETGEILQQINIRNHSEEYYINLIKKDYYINNTEYDKYDPDILCVYVFDSLESKTTKQQEIIDTFLEDVKYALEVAFEECDETYTHIDLDIPKSLDDDTLWQGIWETMEDNGISYTVKHKNTKFNYNYYYVYIHYYNTENVFGRIGERMKKYVKSTIIESSIQVSGYDDASRKLKALSDGEIIQYTGNKLGGVVEAVANALEVGDEFTISAEVGYIAPGPDNDGTHTITTTFLVTDAYRYGNGYAPIYQGRSPQLNANQSRRWRDITNGALWLLGNREYTIVIHKSSQSITSVTL